MTSPSRIARPAAAPAPGAAPVVLLTLGRLPVALALARGFHALGWRVLVADPFGLHLCSMSRAVARSFRVTAPRDDPAEFLDDLERIIRAEQVQLVVPMSEETLHVAGLHDRGLPGTRVTALPRRHLLDLHDKLRFNQLAAGLGLPVPASACSESAAAVQLAKAGPTVLKPRFSCSGRGVQFLSRGAAVPPRSDALVQQHIEGPALSSFSLAREGRLAGTVVYRSAINSGSVAVCFERVAEAPAVISWVEEFVRRTGHDGFIAFDFIVDARGRALAIECNPRATSGIHFFTPQSLATALLATEAGPMEAHPQALQCESWSAFTACLGLLFGRGDARAAWASLGRAHDVSWSARDPWPFLLMMINTAPLIARALVRRQTFAEVAALDIEWRPHDGTHADA